MNFIYAFQTDDSATINELPFCATHNWMQPTLTHSQLVDLVCSLDDDVQRDVIETWTDADIYSNLHEFHDVDAFAVVPVEHYNIIKAVGDALGDTMVNDSSCYSAAEVFRDTLLKYACSTKTF